MVVGYDVRRPLDAVDHPQQGNDVAGPGLFDGAMEAGEGADMDHA
jgi:hypothetical protein